MIKKLGNGLLEILWSKNAHTDTLTEQRLCLYKRLKKCANATNRILLIHILPLN